jgi:hypothetical protein
MRRVVIGSELSDGHALSAPDPNLGIEVGSARDVRAIQRGLAPPAMIRLPNVLSAPEKIDGL